MEKKKIETNDFIKEIFKDPRIPEEFGLNRCIQCGNCSASCPAARYTDYRPRKIIQDILIGAREKLIQSEDIWLCFSCFSCNLRCPRNNNPGLVIHIIRQMAVREGYGKEKVEKFKSYLESLRDNGLGMTPYSLSRELFQDLDDDWIKIKEQLPAILIDLHMNPKPPRELPKEAREQIRIMLELAEINEDIENIGKNVEGKKINGDA